ncbi:MAG: hypothetical protein O2816_09090 [Planctomycetota bacterium]|nr:hypothetical protein [Planctomycetota bacterium]
MSTINLVRWRASLGSLAGLTRTTYGWFDNVEERHDPIDGPAAFPISSDDLALIEHGFAGEGPMSAAQVRGQTSLRYVSNLLDEGEEPVIRVRELVVNDALDRCPRPRASPTSDHWKDGRRAGVELVSVQEGDGLTSIIGHKVHTEAEVVAYVKGHQDRVAAWEVLVLRHGQEEALRYCSQGD